MCNEGIRMCERRKVTSCRLFKLLVMFFGLTNSPSTFQIMEEVVCVHLDVILIYTKTMEEHHHITHLVLEQLANTSFSCDMTNVNLSAHKSNTLDL